MSDFTDIIKKQFGPGHMYSLELSYDNGKTWTVFKLTQDEQEAADFGLQPLTGVQKRCLVLKAEKINNETTDN